MPEDKGVDQGSAKKTTKNFIDATLARIEAAMLVTTSHIN
jgi:hypothetical protein